MDSQTLSLPKHFFHIHAADFHNQTLNAFLIVVFQILYLTCCLKLRYKLWSVHYSFKFLFSFLILVSRLILIQTVQELWSEMCSQIIHDHLLCLWFDIAIFVHTIQQILRSNIGCHDQDRILESPRYVPASR